MAESENEKKLAAAKEVYENLLLKYTEKHPDVAKIKKTIEKLEKSIEEEKKTLDVEEKQASAEELVPDENIETLTDSSDGMGNMPNFAAMQQEAQLKQVKNEIQKIESDIATIEKNMKLYQQRVEDTPKRELELQALKRDYSNIQDIFNSLLDRKLEAELSVNMEKKQKGEQFRILDHARLPEKPISPNVKLLFLLSIALGGGVGGGIIFLMEVFNISVIRRDEQIEKVLGLNILATIPPLERPGGLYRQRMKNIIFAGCCTYAVIFLGFFIILNIKGIDRTINFIKMQLNF